MKIAVIAPSVVPSNSANSIQVMKVSQALVDNGHEVSLWLPGQTTTPWGDLAEIYGISSRFAIHWLRTIGFARRYDFAAAAVIKAMAWKADLNYTWMPQVAAICCIFRVPVILEIHMLPSGVFGPYLLKLIINSRAKKRLLPITEALHQYLEKALSMKIPPEIVQISPMGFDQAQYENLPDPPTARAQLGISADGLVAGYTGHLYPGRGMDILVDLAEAYPEVLFLWVGGRAEDVAYWKKKIALAGLRNITLTGFVPNSQLPRYQAASDILLMPYDYVVGVSSRGNTAEVCSPMKMFDYLAAGRTIMTSDLPVLHEVLNDRNAVFCPPGNQKIWVDTFGSLIDDPALRQRLASQARMDARDYTWRSRAEKAIRNFP